MRLCALVPGCRAGRVKPDKKQRAAVKSMSALIEIYLGVESQAQMPFFGDELFG